MRARSLEQGVPWSLVLFTVLTQAAVGLAAGTVILDLVLRARGEIREGPIGAIYWAAFGFFALGCLAAATHLGRPSAARHVGANLRSSWLSREALLGAAFGSGLLLLMVWGPHAAAAITTAAAGLAFVVAVTRVYRVRTVPAWDHGTTPASFLGTAVLLGAALLALLFPRISIWGGIEAPWLPTVLRALGLVVLLAAVWQVGVANVRHHRFPLTEGVGGLTKREHRLTLSVQIVGTLIGAALLFTAAWWGSSALGSRLSRMPSFLVAFVLLLASELIGRWRFYASHRRLGL